MARCLGAEEDKMLASYELEDTFASIKRTADKERNPMVRGVGEGGHWRI